MTVMEAIQARKSVRRYLDKPVEEEKLQQILEAGGLAPSAKNQQAWKFLVVRDGALRARLREACENQKFVEEAPVSLVICTNEERDMLCGQPARTIDSAIALSFMMLEAEELGLGTCWLGRFRADKVKEILEIPEDYSVVAVCPLGYAAENATAGTKRKAQEEIVLWDKWN